MSNVLLSWRGSGKITAKNTDEKPTKTNGYQSAGRGVYVKIEGDGEEAKITSAILKPGQHVPAKGFLAFYGVEEGGDVISLCVGAGKTADSALKALERNAGDCADHVTENITDNETPFESTKPLAYNTQLPVRRARRRV